MHAVVALSDRESEQGPPTMEETLAIAARCGITLLGPVPAVAA